MQLPGLISSSLAVAAQQATGTASKAQPQGPDMSQIVLMLVAMFALYYFMVHKPQKQDQQRAKDMRDNLKHGDKVRSIGGIYGTVVSVDTGNHIVTVQVDKNVKLDFDRDAIATVVRSKKEES